VDSSNYKATYKNNKNAGTATVTITGTGKYSGTVTGHFTIYKAPQQITNVLSTYKKKYSSSSFKLNAKAKTAVTYVSSNKKVAVVNKSTGKVKIKGCGKAVITITAKGKNYKTATKKVTIRVVPNKTSITKLKSTSKSKINITYKKKTGATGYEVVYSTSKTFKAAKTKTKLIKGKSKNKAVIKGLKAGKKYYVKVRAYKTIDGKKYYSSYSKVKTVVVKR
jgi:urease beta subunit